jgi:hypothetical protein
MILELVELRQTCHSCPSQWEGKTKDGRTFYARYRHSCWRVDVDGETVADGDTDEFDGGFCTFEELVLWAGGHGVQIILLQEEQPDPE